MGKHTLSTPEALTKQTKVEMIGFGHESDDALSLQV